MMTWPDLLNRPHQKPDAQIPYGSDPLQHVDLWLPPGDGPHPVVVMVHGGCWQTSVADATLMDYAAADLRSHGIAVWNIEYRGVDRPGGGYPGTFSDVAAAADALVAQASFYHLRLARVVGFGHSAGGHLALWLAVRGGIAASSSLHAQHPLPLAAVISAGGLPDLAAAMVPPGDTCGADAVQRLIGVPSAARPNVLSDTSPPEMPPFAAQQILINAADDRIAPPAFAAAYAYRAKRHGLKVATQTIADEGHVELISPGSASWSAARRTIMRALR